MKELNFEEGFKKVIQKDKIINDKSYEYEDLIKERNKYFEEVVHELNNHRNELIEDYGLKSYNYADICKIENADVVEDDLLEYCFKVVFFNRPRAKELGIIEEITGCIYVGENMRSHGKDFYFQLPSIWTHNLVKIIK